MCPVSPAPNDYPDVGSVHAGCRIEKLLGRGGMGAAFLAQRQDGQRVVLKFLAPEVAKNPELRARFAREWDALKKVHAHPNVVRILGVHEEAVLPCIEMEFVQGHALEDVLKTHGKITAAKAVEIGIGVARGLGAVHAHGLIHRDVKPGNVLVDAEGTAKIVDFGLAKDQFLSAMTQPGQILGTASYMAFEQWEDEEVGAHSDVFALGATLYHLMCGHSPFDGDDLDEIADMALAGEYEPPRTLVPEISEDLELVLHQMLMPNPRFRYARAEDCAADLERAQRGEPVSVPSLERSAGGRTPLIPDEWFTLGSDSACQVHLQGSTVAAKHAQIRREEKGFVLRDLKSPGGTWVRSRQAGDQQSAAEQIQPGKGRLLRDGDDLRIGDVSLTFRDPREPSEQASFLRDVVREQHPAAVVHALVAQGDARTLLTLLERLAPDPYRDQHAAHVLGGLFGPDVAQQALAQRSASEADARARLPQLLSSIGRASAPADPTEWLAWWNQVRLGAPPQVGVALPPRLVRVRGQGPVTPELVPAPDQSLILVGRDERCHLKIESREVPRLYATLLRLHCRWIVLADGPTPVLKNGQAIRQTFFDPGDLLTLGPVQLTLEAQPPGAPAPLPGGLYAIGEGAFDALEALAHPSVASAEVGFLVSAQHPEWTQQAALALYPQAAHPARGLAERLYAAVRERAQRARALLPRIFGRDAGDSPQAWEQVLAASRASLPPQVAPQGW